MQTITMNVGDSFVVGGSTVVQFDRAGNDHIRLTIDAPEKARLVRGAAADSADIQARLECLAREISEDVSALDAEESKELIGAFVSELFLALAKQSQREERRQKVVDGIAAAKAKGVKFGRARTPLPDNFDECRQAWRDGELSLQEAADFCGMNRDTFRRAVRRREEPADCAAP